MGNQREEKILSNSLGAKGNVGDMVERGLRKDTPKASSTLACLRRIFSPQFEFVITANGCEKLTQAGCKPLDLYIVIS